MRKRIAFWGTDTQKNKVFIALGLKAKENEIVGHIIPAESLTQEIEDKIVKMWRNGTEIEFPESTTKFKTALSVTEGLLPEGFETEHESVLRRAQSEWNFIVLSQKMNDLFQHELDEIKDKISNLASYEAKAWDSLRGFWGKVQTQISDKNILRDHATKLKEQTNSLFERLKELRNSSDLQFKANSTANAEKFNNELDALDKKIESGLSLHTIFGDLKKLQQNLKDTDFTKGHRRKIWNRIDKMFKLVKEKKYGDSAKSGNAPLERLMNRLNGLNGVIDRMDRSIKRDQQDLNFNNKRMQGEAGQFETEIRKAKLIMIEERLNSKKEKLTDMMVTKEQIESRIEREKSKEEKRKEAHEKQKKIKIAEQQIAKEKKSENPVAKGEELDKLLKAAETINKSRKQTLHTEQTKESTSKKTESSSAISEVVEKVEDVMEDVIDTVSAVALVIGDKIESLADKIMSKDEEE